MSPSSGEGRMQWAEVAGGTMAECAVVCCCCPCGLVNLLVLAVYKLPSGLCRKALRRKRCRPLIKNTRQSHADLQMNSISGDVTPVAADKLVRRLKSSEKDVLEVEKEMWDGFYGTGFWRSPS
ncbi:uncharacterized protein LOC132293202 [Cornus florida]|uniref:uncharacterized protein LOC132293202 n=1 Tax=Cornus florida TaxID=4283 RepID=UPI002897FB4C|nr:uncharacterized protein LOC132293202 [Cornus florida]